TECAGLAALYAGDLSNARALLIDAMSEHRAVDDLLGLANAMILLAGATFFLGDPAGAAVAEECLRLCEEHGATWTKCYALWAVAIHQWLAGDHRSAATTIQEAVRLQRSVHDWTGLAYFLEVLAWCAGSAEEPERTARLLGAATAVWQLSGARAFEAPPYHTVDEQAANQAHR